MSTGVPTPPPAEMVNCPGCGGRNPVAAGECDWCGRQFVSPGRRLRLTIWQTLSTLVCLAMIGAVVALVLMNAGRTLPAPRLPAPPPQPASASSAPTPAVTPRVTSGPTATPALVVVATATPSTPTPEPVTPEEPAATPTPDQATARIANTGGQGVMVRSQPGPQAAAVGALREGATVLLTGSDQVVAARTWRQVETEDHRVKGWILADFLQSAP